jgi:glutamate synthase (ferredoxin)
MEPGQWDHDACGVAVIVDRRGRSRHEWLARALEALTRLTHRGAPGEGRGSADGAGVMTAIPWSLFAGDVPARFADSAAVRAAGVCFAPASEADDARRAIAEALDREGWCDLAWRLAPTDRHRLGDLERATCPEVWQVAAIHVAGPARSEAQLEQSLYRARLDAEARLLERGLGGAALISLSMRTLVYKALVAPADLASFYADLADARFETPFAIVHQRFSTNTFPQWALAQPFRVLAHNGEINTVLGNRLHARRRQDGLAGADGARSGARYVRETGSDSQSLDDMVDNLRQAGFSLAHAFARLLPRAWEHDVTLTPGARAFEQYQAAAVEPWEGPAAIAFCDGRQAGAVLDRNGFRPLRVLLSTDGLVTVGSETGIFDIPEAQVERRGRLGPGEMLVVDLESGALLENLAVRKALAAARPYRKLIERTVVSLPERGDGGHTAEAVQDLALVQRYFGYTAEELELIVRPMADEGKEAIGSMGDDAPLAILSARRRLLPDYFRQRFAQVTNPPIDPLREQMVMSLHTLLGRRGSVHDDVLADARLVACESPVLSDAQLDSLRHLADRPAAVVDTTFDAAAGASGFRAALGRIAHEATAHVSAGATLIVLSDRAVCSAAAPLPSLLSTAAVDLALARAGLSSRASVVVDSGEPRDAHQVATLLAFGAGAVCPWLGCHTAEALAARNGEAPLLAVGRYLHALDHGLLKVLSRMGVCTTNAYRGAHLMEAVGLDRQLLDSYFPDTASVPGVLSLDDIAAESTAWHEAVSAASSAALPHPGIHGYRRDGEYHAYNPVMVKAFHQAVATGAPDAYARFTALVDDRPAVAVRDLLTFRPQPAVPLDEVEPVERIVTRFFASAMSVGALGPEAHRVLAMAMNRLGARSNSGEGGEEPERFVRPATGDWAASLTKQVASARFGVTPAYLRSATELQIKMAQGSKPGEGGQLPAAKVVEHIAALRHARPGTPLISPPPHHDIYSIEDLAQLIYDLRSFHPAARINVKLVSTTGIGVIAAGVVKAGAQAIQISGHDGGTGASPRGSIKHAGLPWEIGLNDAHRVLTSRGVRHRVVLQADGGLKTGRDVALAAALGADEYGFGTAALVALGCLMARQCHLNTCPVGIATQRADLRAKFGGTVDQAITYFTLVARDVRQILASLGLRSLGELVGRLDLLRLRDETALPRLDLTRILAAAEVGSKREPDDAAELGPAGSQTLNGRLVARARRTLGRETVVIAANIRNTDRTVGATLAGLVAEEYGDAGTPHAPIRVQLSGHAGQSFGAFSIPGLEMTLVGDANDGVAKGMHGGTIAIRPPVGTRLCEQVLVGNAALYGATGGRLFVAGRAGERFAVRNSGAMAVVEGVGHHGCEYMTGGVVAVLGPTGLNFGAGMTGGTAYVLDSEGRLGMCLNHELVRLDSLVADDEQTLHALLVDHHAATASALAARLLADWSASVTLFAAVQPKGDYSRVDTRTTVTGHSGLHSRPGTVSAVAGAASSR